MVGWSNSFQGNLNIVKLDMILQIFVGLVYDLLLTAQVCNKCSKFGQICDFDLSVILFLD